jgi:two-component system NtrC family response regulator
MTNDSKQPESLKILFADDEESLQELMRMELPQMGHTVTVCPDGATAVAALEKDSFDCLLVDLDMPGIGGMQVIERAHQLSPTTESIVLTGKHTFDSAVAALRFGATDYLTKPCKLSELEALLHRVAQRRELRRKYIALQRQLAKTQQGTNLVGQHASMDGVRKLISMVAPKSSTVLVRGETGCGKELVAQAVHDQSLRKDEPFVAINCGALPENLIESELFGHKKGAFTGADSHRQGLFEVASGGTLFLDEVGELPLSMQAKLLRVLESGEIRKVGDNQSSRVDVRVVCATHRDLHAMVAEGTFREDLMFRINAFEINIPPLRERIEDIEPLAKHLLYRFRPDLAKMENLFSPETVVDLTSHSWPGNVRELANVIEHATILCENPPILPEHLPRHFAQRSSRPSPQLGPMSLRELELTAIQESVERHRGNKTAAAEELGISLKTLYNKLNQAELQGRKTA